MAEAVRISVRPVRAGALGTGWHPVALAREAFTGAFQGSRRELAEVTAWRTQAGLVFVWLAARGALLVQAGIDLAVGRGAYARPGLAEGLALACLAESALLAVQMIRAQRLMLWPLLADTAFGIAGLAVMSAATTPTPGRAGSLNWMLPYTVATVAGLGLLSAFDGRGAAGTGAGRPRWLPLPTAQALAVAALAAAYLVSVNVPRRLPQDDPLLLWGNAANYVGFFLVAFVLAVLLRRWLAKIAQRNDEAARQAAELSHAAHWRALTVDVFGPVLELFDKLAGIGEEVPAPLRAEAGRLIRLIDAVRPDAEETSAVSPPGGRREET
jgi:hypothetical protein